MKPTGSHLDASLTAFAAEWAESSEAGVDPASVMLAAMSMTDAGVLRSAAAHLRLQRISDVYRLTMAGEIAYRSDAMRGEEGMAKRAGYSRPAQFVAEFWKITTAAAYRLCELGLAIRPRTAIDGTTLPSLFPLVQHAVLNGEIGVDAGVVIVKELRAASPRCSPEARLTAEKELVLRADDFSITDFEILARQVRDRLDQDGPELRDALRRERRSLRLFAHHDGMMRLQWDMPPEIGGLVKAGVDAIVSRELHQGPHESENLAADSRSLEQLRSDAAETIFRHAATCASAGGELPSITMVIRMTRDELLSGMGIATIDGVGETISAATARKLAVDAQLLPIVLGADSVVLDFGAARRLFSPAQKLVLAERDGGCAWGGCSAPPSYTEAHHIQWWSKNPNSDLSNGILLCSFHHHRVHDGEWEISVDAGIPYFIPPPWVDPERTPRRGGRVTLQAA